MAKKVLIITYYWPPSGGAGVQRWLKFVKYLRNFGWEPVVYTADNAEYPVADYTLEKDIPPNLEVLKTKVWEPYDIYKKFIGLKKGEKINAAFLSEKKKPKLTEKIAVWIRGNFFIPDARRFWIKPSVTFLTRYLEKNPVQAIISTGPPQSMHLIALNLKKKFNLPWIADFRDPWTGINYFKDFQLTKWAYLKHQQLEKKVLQNADKVVVVSEGMKKHFNEIAERDYEVITNGFDEDDAPTLPITLDKKFTIAHIGTLSKTQNPQVLWEVLKDLTQSNMDFASNLEIKLVGYVDVVVTDSIQSYGLTPFVRRIPYLPHDEVISEQYKSHVLLLVINNAPNSGLILTGKFFEYMASRRPIMCIGPKDGDAAKIVEETQCGFFSGFEETNILKNNILKLFNDFENGDLQHQGTNIAKYSRLKLTERFSGILNSITVSSSGH